MRSFSSIQLKKRSTGLSWLVLVVYAWLSTVVQFAHTDDLRAVLIQTAASNPAATATHAEEPGVRAVIRQAPHTAPAQPCAACEWVGSVHTATVPSLTMAQLPVGYDIVRAEQFTVALLQRGNRLATLRGPPAAA